MAPALPHAREEEAMGKVIRREFVGNRWLLVALSLTGVGLPLAVLYLIEGTVTVSEELEDPNAFLDWLRRRG